MIRFVIFVIFAGQASAAQPLPLPDTPSDLDALKQAPWKQLAEKRFLSNHLAFP